MTNTEKNINWRWRTGRVYLVDLRTHSQTAFSASSNHPRIEPGRNSSSTTFTFSLFAVNHSIDDAIPEAVPASHFEAAKLTDE
jgi:hypothetical protein